MEGSTRYKKYYDDDDEDDDEFDSFDDDSYLAQGGSSLNTGKKNFFYNDMNPNHTRGVFLVLCLAFCFLIFLVFSLVNDFDAIVRFMKVHNLVPPKHHRNIFRHKQFGVRRHVQT